jgi:hypothetical protein
MKLRVRRWLLLGFAVGAAASLSSCADYGDGEVHGSVSMYYGVGFYDPWYYGGGYYGPPVVVTPGPGHPGGPGGPDVGGPRPEQPIAKPPQSRPPSARPTPAASRPAPRPTRRR